MFVNIKILLITFLLFLFFLNKSFCQETKNSISLPIAIWHSAVTDFRGGSMGIGYEYRPFDFIGIELSGFGGRFKHDKYSFDKGIEPYGINSLHVNGTVGGLYLSTKGYLVLDPDGQFDLYLEYYAGSSIIKANGYGVYRSYDISGSNTSGINFFHGLSLGFRGTLFPKVDALLSIGGNSLDFTGAVRNIDFNTPPDITVNTTTYRNIVFKFGFMVNLN